MSKISHRSTPYKTIMTWAFLSSVVAGGVTYLLSFLLLNRFSFGVMEILGSFGIDAKDMAIQFAFLGAIAGLVFGVVLGAIAYSRKQPVTEEK